MKYTLDYQKYAELARRVAAEGSVLLRNEEDTLPLRRGQRVSVFGRTQFEHYKSGTGSGGMVNAPYVTNIIDSLKEDGTIQVNEALEKVYREWLKEHPFDNRMQRSWSSGVLPGKIRITVRRREAIC